MPGKLTQVTANKYGRGEKTKLMNKVEDIVDFSIRTTDTSDCPLILSLICELAEYEKLSHEVIATVTQLEETLFGDKAYAEVLIGEYQGQPVAYALFFHNFSTFTGRPGIYLEDVYVKPKMRGKGFGTAIMRHLAKLTVARDCTRFEWSVLDWNEPSIKFYRSIGAVPMTGWTIQRMDGAALTDFANNK